MLRTVTGAPLIVSSCLDSTLYCKLVNPPSGSTLNCSFQKRGEKNNVSSVIRNTTKEINSVSVYLRMQHIAIQHGRRFPVNASPPVSVQPLSSGLSSSRQGHGCGERFYTLFLSHWAWRAGKQKMTDWLYYSLYLETWQQFFFLLVYMQTYSVVFLMCR
jgi:hypothetical protein